MTRRKSVESQEFGRLLRSVRTQAGLSQYDLAELINWSDSMVSLWERGLMSPNPDQLRSLRSVLGDFT